MILVVVLPRCRNRRASWPKCPWTRATMPSTERISKDCLKTEARFTCIGCRSEWTTRKQTKQKANERQRNEYDHQEQRTENQDQHQGGRHHHESQPDPRARLESQNRHQGGWLQLESQPNPRARLESQDQHQGRWLHHESQRDSRARLTPFDTFICPASLGPTSSEAGPNLFVAEHARTYSRLKRMS